MPAPCLACHRSPDRAWDTGPVAGGSNVSTPDQASQALSMRIRWDRSEMPELCTRPSRGWQMAAHTVTRARGRRAAQEGGTPKPLPPPPRGVEDTHEDPSCPGEGQSLLALVLEMSLTPCSGSQWWKPCGSSQSSDGDEGAPKDGRPAPAWGSEPAQAWGPLSCAGTSWAGGAGLYLGTWRPDEPGTGDPTWLSDLALTPTRQFSYRAA